MSQILWKCLIIRLMTFKKEKKIKKSNVKDIRMRNKLRKMNQNVIRNLP